MALLRRPVAAHPTYHPLTVVAVDPVAEHAVSIALAAPDDPAAAADSVDSVDSDPTAEVPRSSSYLRYRPGQYVTLRAAIDGEEVRQSYSLWTPPERARAEGVLRIAAARVQGGRMSPWLATRVHVGDTIDVLPPMGDFTLDDDPNPRVHAAVAGGSGITPVLAILAAALTQNGASTATLVLANRTRASSVLRDEVAAVQAASDGRLTVHDVLSREQGPHLGQGLRRIDALLLDETWPHPEDVDAWWLCGPEGLNVLVELWLDDAGVSRQRVHRERFTSTGPVDPVRRPEGASPVMTDTRAQPADTCS